MGHGTGKRRKACFSREEIQPYTDDDLNYNDENSRVSQEYADESLRDVELDSTTVDNWDSYDTVFIGADLVGHCSMAGRYIR